MKLTKLFYQWSLHCCLLDVVQDPEANLAPEECIVSNLKAPLWVLWKLRWLSKVIKIC